MKTTFRDRQVGACVFGALYAAAWLLVNSVRLLAADGAWNVDADGTWATSGNWLGGIVADGPGSTAYFTNDITATRTVTVGAEQTIGNLHFGDADAASTPGAWIVTGSNLVLTSSATVPVIRVDPINTLSDPTNDVQILSRIIAAQGFVKKGTGTLTLTASNFFGSSVRLEEGEVFPVHANAISTGNRAVIFSGGAVRVVGGGPALGFTNQIVGTGGIKHTGGNYDSYNGPFIGTGTVLISSPARLTIGGGAAGAFSGFTGTIDLTDSTSGNNTRINLGGTSIYDMKHLTLHCGTNGGRFTFRTTTTPTRVLIGALSGGPSSRLQSSEQGGCTSLYWEIGYLNTSTTFEGTIRNYNGMADRVGHLVKVGTGKLTLTGSSDYTGVTVISNGVLALAGGAALTGPTNYITVMAGATFDVSGLNSPFGLRALQTLGGNGVVTGDVALVAGTISPGVGIGTLSFSNNLSMSGSSTVTNRFEITAPGASDMIIVGGNLTLADTVVVRVVPTGPVIPNGVYPLIRWGGTLSGDIANLSLEYPAQQGTLALKKDAVAKQIYLEVTGVPGAANLIWRGDGSANNWDLSTPNWWNGAALTTFRNGDNAIFDDTGSNNVPVNIATEVNPA
ncbi:MAG: autotransporter-associated beta strand repeat-containing protein, partial [Verrucomicrobiae bacterium]|nr:autotransporter-associated beta strand repeat-containing protein [Verrucomicrobiae bacterium]MDW7979486.1 autotransporter-associated beta strand repeat-containing protein [Verrucomicrobiales bacterium]